MQHVAVHRADVDQAEHAVAALAPQGERVARFELRQQREAAANLDHRAEHLRRVAHGVGQDGQQERGRGERRPPMLAPPLDPGHGEPDPQQVEGEVAQHGRAADELLEELGARADRRGGDGASQGTTAQRPDGVQEPGHAGEDEHMGPIAQDVQRRVVADEGRQGHQQGHQQQRQPAENEEDTLPAGDAFELEHLTPGRR